MLQKYLDASLLSLKDDEDFKKLQKSSTEIAKKLTKNKYKIASYTLSAIDPNISPENSDIVEVKEVIIKNWKTFTANSTDSPLTFIKAVMFDALHNISAEIQNSLIIWFASRNIIKYQKLIGKEKEIILEFITKLGSKINEEGNREWTLLQNNPSSKTNFELKEISAYIINKEFLQKHLEDASGTTNSKGVANYDSPNEYFPNSGQHWSFQFAPKAADGIKKAVDSTLKAIVQEINDSNDVIKNSFETNFTKLREEILNSGKSLELRSELLWWKEAKYSVSTDKGYKELDQNILEIVLASDYSSFIPIIYPKSVDYFLKETLYQIKKEDTEIEITFEDYFKIVEDNKEQLKLIFSEEEIIVNKFTFLDFIKNLIWSKNQISQFEELVGIPLKIKISHSELITWLFHDFQLIKILNSK